MKFRVIMKRIFRGLIVSATLVVGLSGYIVYSAPLSSGGSEEHTQVKNPVKVVCENGVMLGKPEGRVISFKGVPFAKPPVGKLRWKAPQAPDPSGDEIKCYDFGYTALQYEWASEPASYSPKNEDCLTLNIWENQRVIASKVRKPVMVFFHGGAYGWGGTTDPMYNGHNFAKAHDDVILVTCNYRLGLMAFPDFSKTEGGGEYTDINLALRDHIAALQWIQKNIAGFGGDPDNVTIFGESAGSWSVTALAVSPKARGLFRRVIAQSGEMVARDRKEAQKYADFIMKASGAKNMKELMAISGDEWMKLDSEKNIADECCHIVIDEDIIPKDLDKAFADAAKSGVQMVMGSNNDEWNYFKEDSEGDTGKEKFDAWVKDMDDKYNEAYGSADKEGKAALEELIKYEESIVPEEYAGDRKVKEALAKSGFVSETWRYEILDFADRFAEAGGDIRVYLWKVPSTRENMYKSAVHAVEMAYVFNNLEDDIYAGEVDLRTAAKVQASWVNFAKAGDPSVKGARWKKYNTDTRDTMVIEKDKWKCVSDPSKKARELLKKAYGNKPYHVW